MWYRRREALGVSLSSRSGVSLWFQPPVTFGRTLADGTASLILYDILHAGAREEFGVVSPLYVLILILWFYLTYVLYALDISKLL